MSAILAVAKANEGYAAGRRGQGLCLEPLPLKADMGVPKKNRGLKWGL